MLRVTLIEKKVSQMVDLLVGMWISIGIADHIDHPDETKVRYEFARDGKHLDLFEPMVACFFDFGSSQPVDGVTSSNDVCIIALVDHQLIDRL